LDPAPSVIKKTDQAVD